MSWRDPKRPHAIYRVWSASNELLYIGCSVSPLARVMEHSKYKAWACAIDRVTVEWFDNKPDAQAAEKAAIQSENPTWNSHFTGCQKRARGVFHRDFRRDDPATWVQQ